MITVAVTGGIGSGKSTVSTALRERGAVVADSDQLAREVVAPGTPGIAAIADAFGADMIDPDGSLDRAALAGVVFADPAARSVLERITHPLVRARFVEITRQAAPDAIVVNDIPLLTSLTAAASFHLVVGVRADAESRVERLIGRGLAEADARARMAAQLTDDERAPLCDVVLDNQGDRRDLVATVHSLWSERLVPFERNTRAARGASRGGPVLVEPQARWALDARRLAARVSMATGGSRVDHIGSTSIPGMPAKDVLDLQLTVPSLPVAGEIAVALAAAGFPQHLGIDRDTPQSDEGSAADDANSWRKSLHVNADPGQSLNLHVRVRDSPNWQWALMFRDWLTAEPDVAAEYLAVKRSAALAHAGDVDSAAYADAKEPWLAAAYPRGRAWARQTGWRPTPN